MRTWRSHAFIRSGSVHPAPRSHLRGHRGGVLSQSRAQRGSGIRYAIRLRRRGHARLRRNSEAFGAEPDISTLANDPTSLLWFDTIADAARPDGPCGGESAPAPSVRDPGRRTLQRPDPGLTPLGLRTRAPSARSAGATIRSIVHRLNVLMRLQRVGEGGACVRHLYACTRSRLTYALPGHTPGRAESG